MSKRILKRFFRIQCESPLRLLVAVLATAAISLLFATRLEVRAGFEALLPDATPSVLELRRVTARTGGASTVFVVLEGDDSTELRALGDDLVAALSKLGEPWVTQAEDNIHDAERFIAPRAGLYASLEDLTQLEADVSARFEYEAARELGTDLGTAPEDIPVQIDAALVKARLHLDRFDQKRFPDGYFQSADGKTLVVTIRSGIVPSDLVRGRNAIDQIDAVVRSTRESTARTAIRYGITGDLAIAISEYESIHRDLTHVGVTGAVLLGAIVFLYYLRLRTLFAMGITIAVGLSWTFGLTELVLGHLNLATAFLFTIIAGNGINVAIIYMARYLEERRAGLSLVSALEVASRETWKPTLTGALAAAAAYGSLSVTGFRGFREFGIIGGSGMLVCWLATYATLPPVLAFMERVSPLRHDQSGSRSWIDRVRRTLDGGTPFGRPFAYLVETAPRAVVVAGLALMGLGAIGGAIYLRSNPMEYDLTRVQSDPRSTAEPQRLIGIAKEITGYVGLDGMAILVDRLDQVAPLKAALEARRDAAPASLRPFQAVHALQDLVPSDQEAKLPVLMKLRDRILRARKLRAIGDTDWKQIASLLPPADLQPFGITDLPASVARPFTERDGTRGRIVYISPTEGASVSDAHYLFRWADSFRRTTLPDGSEVLGSGRAVIYADMWTAIMADIPRAVLLSFIATALIVWGAFRSGRGVAQVLFGLIVGVAWMAGLLQWMEIKLNFLNFIALPITFGIGVDYAVNIVHRMRSEDPVSVIRGTGGAVILCSLTTLLGYIALCNSTNFAVRSLGVVAAFGEVVCLVAAVLVLPAAVVWWRSRGAHQVRASHEPRHSVA